MGVLEPKVQELKTKIQKQKFKTKIQKQKFETKIQKQKFETKILCQKRFMSEMMKSETCEFSMSKKIYK